MMEVVDYLRVLRRRWILVAAAPVIALGIALAITVPNLQSATAREGQYKAQHLLYRADPATSMIPLGTVATVASSGRVRQDASARLDDRDAERLVAGVTVSAESDLRLVMVEAIDTDPERAERVVDTYAAQILAYFAGRSEPRSNEAATLESQLDRQQRQIDDIDAQLDQIDPASDAASKLRRDRDELLRKSGRTGERLAQAGGGVTFDDIGLQTLQGGVAQPVDESGFQPPTTPGPRLLLATLMGLLLGVALAFVIDKLDTRIRTRRDAEAAFGLPVLAEIPRLRRRGRRSRGVVTTAQPASMAAEAYRGLRLGLQVMSRWVLRASSTPGSVGEMMAQRLDRTDTQPRVFLVTSAGPGEGKTTTVANLAASFAEVDQRVLLLDCDFRSPQLARMLGADRGTGVSDYLRSGPQGPPLVELARPSSIRNVWVVPSGEAVGNPAELLGPDTSLLHDAAQLADIVLVDVGPLLAVNDGATLAPQVDAVVVVARHGQTTVDAARRTSELLARVEAPLAGVALVGVAAAELSSPYHHYGYAKTPSSNGSRNGTASKEHPQRPRVVR